MFTAVRISPIKNLVELARARAHGRRTDEASAKRVDPLRTSLNRYFSPYADDPTDIVSGYHKLLEEQNATPYGRAAICMHVMAIVSTEWIEETGDLHDPDNIRNKLLFDTAIGWVISTFGEASLIAARQDFDEAGGGVVDLFVCPIFATRLNAHTSRNVISINKALSGIVGDEIDRCSYSAAQTSWHAYAATHMDSQLARGRRKSETHRVHVHADIFRPAAQAAVEAAREEAQKAFDVEYDDHVTQLLREKQQLANQKDELKQKITEIREHLAAENNRVQTLKLDLKQREDAVASREKEIIKTSSDLRAAWTLYDHGGFKLRWNEAAGRNQLVVADHVQGTERMRAHRIGRTASQYGLAGILVKLAEASGSNAAHWMRP